MTPSPEPISADSGGEYRFSYGRFVVVVLGTGVAVLVVCVPIILALAAWNAIAGLVGALVAVVAMIAAIGITSKIQIGKAERALRAARENPPPAHS